MITVTGRGPHPRWWFQICFYVHPDPWGNDPIWLIFFKRFETTNYFLIKRYIYLSRPKGAEWMIRGAHVQSFRIQTAPFGRCWHIYKRNFPVSPKKLKDNLWWLDFVFQDPGFQHHYLHNLNRFTIIVGFWTIPDRKQHPFEASHRCQSLGPKGWRCPSHQYY